jgi:phospholipid/cholesterol/gamma-HCH transport system permease protein
VLGADGVELPHLAGVVVPGLLRDHERHIQTLNDLILELGGTPKHEPHATGPFKEALQSLGGLAGDKGVLIAWRTNELQVRTKYDTYASRAMLWPDHVKRAIDDDPRPGRFLLTGSVRAELTSAGWPATGRVVRVPLWGLCERELASRVGAGSLIVGGGMLFVIAALAFFTGTQVGLQGVASLEQIGAQAYVGLISSFANVREITPLIAGIALAAKIGAGYTAELGAMRISEEIDAAEVIGIRPIPYLVSTRLWAALIPTIPLYLLALFSAFLATRLIVTGFFTVSPGAYDTRLELFLPPIDILYSVAKAVVFVIVVILIHTYYGFYAKGGPAGVGVAVGRAIRASITAVVILNMILSLAFWAAGGETIKIAG